MSQRANAIRRTREAVRAGSRGHGRRSGTRLTTARERRLGRPSASVGPAGGAKGADQPLPLEPDRVTAPWTAAQTARRRRVLVADDEASLRVLLRVNLPLAGYEVVEAADVDTAFELAHQHEFDLFLLDVMMPPTSGLELAERLRADPATSAVPIVFLSARADREDVSRGLASGALDYITKPFDPVRLGKHLDALLDGGTDSGGSEPRPAGDA